MIDFADVIAEEKKNDGFNHVLPFLWIHGTESRERMKDEILHIKKSNINEFCVEARPHCDFNGPKWFEDIQYIIDICKEYEMKFWLLDDSHFPTGFANGKCESDHPELTKQFLCCSFFDVANPETDDSLLLKYALKSSEDKIVGVVAYKKNGDLTVEGDSPVELTKQVDFPYVRLNGLSHEDIWTVAVLFTSRKGGEKQTEGYINPIDERATKVLLDTVYEPIYEHFACEFGKTFRGFFSDEPRFGNIHGAEGASIGRNIEMVLPWKDNMLSLLEEYLEKEKGSLHGLRGSRLIELLPLLFTGESKRQNELRFAYMDLVSSLYSECFDKVIASWCHNHNCLHIGHTIEDNGAASRLGYGAGHIFRAMKNADMTGVDVVIQQLLPGMNKGLFRGMHKPGWDGEFFTYMLSKFASSPANIENKIGAMCEIFGAYGWGEGVRLQKWLCDFMMVRGINFFVPHAFDCAAFPDMDCPPHLYAQGFNPQYPEFGTLMTYVNNVLRLLYKGKPQMDCALYYNAEGEWSGGYMKTQKAARVLTENGITFDLVSRDILCEDFTKAKENRLCINESEYKCLIIPYAQNMPWDLALKLHELIKEGTDVIFLDRACENIFSEEEKKVESCLEAFGRHCVSLTCLADYIRQKNYPYASCVYKSNEAHGMRYYRTIKDKYECIFITNEGTSPIDIEMTLKDAADKYCYIADPFTMKLYCLQDWDGSIKTKLCKTSSLLLVLTNEEVKGAEPYVLYDLSMLKEERLTDCTVRLYDYKNLKEGGIDKEALEKAEVLSLKEPCYISSLKGHEDFSGRIVYSFEKEMMDDIDKGECYIRLEGVREGATVKVNGKLSGTVIAGDYTFRTEGIKKGKNVIEVELNTTLARSQKDFLSQFMSTEPTGLRNVYIYR